MNLITRLLTGLLGRGDSERGVPLLEDVRELYQERFKTRGRLYASARAAWDIAGLSIRPRHSPYVANDRGGPMTARLLDDLRNAIRSVTRRRAAGGAR